MNQNSNQINSFSLIVNLLLILISGILLIGFLTLGYLKNQNKDFSNGIKWKFEVVRQLPAFGGAGTKT